MTKVIKIFYQNYSNNDFEFKQFLTYENVENE